MTTLRQRILATSSIPSGNTVRSHLQSPAAVGIGGGDIYVGAGHTADTGEVLSSELGVSLSSDMRLPVLTADIDTNLSSQIEQGIN